MVMFLLSPEAKTEAKIFIKEILQESIYETLSDTSKKADDDILDVAALAELLKSTPNSVRDLAQSGKIPCYKPGKNYLFIRSEIFAWVASHPKQKSAN
jgi:excisionase family DNA binding protein